MSINIQSSLNKSTPSSLTERSNGNYAIEARHLHVYYGSFLAVNDISLQIETQENYSHNRSFWLWKEHRITRLQSHERSGTHCAH